MNFDQMFPNPLDAVRAPENLDAASVRAWIQRICKALDITPTALAREAGVAPSNLNRFLAGGEGMANLGARTIDKIARTAGHLQLNRFNSEHSDAEEWTDPNAFWLASVRVVATIEEDKLSNRLAYPVERQFMITVPLFGGIGRRPLGFLVGDDHAARAFPRRSLVVGVELAGRAPRSGERLLVSKGKLDYAAISVREYRVSPSGDAWLVSLSSAAVRPPDIYLGKVVEDGLLSHAENSEYRLEYLIVASIRPEEIDKSA